MPLAKRSLRTTLVFLVLLAVLPALGIIAYSGFELRERILAERTAGALNQVEYLSQSVRQAAVSIERILATIALLPPMRELMVDKAELLLDKVREGNPALSNSMLISSDGRILASATPIPAGDISALPHFRRALVSGRFSSGSYQISRASYEPILPFAYPVTAEDGSVTAVVTAGLRVSSFAGLFEKLDLPEGAIFSVIDRDGVRVFRHPESATATPVGKSVAADADVRKCLATAQDLGVYDGKGPDGTPRLYAYAKLRLPGELGPYLHMVVSVPKTQMGREAVAAIKRNMVFLALAGLLALGVAWLVGELLLVRPLRQVAHTAQRIGQGDFSARANLSRQTAETAMLAGAVDDMARTLSLRQDERDRAEAFLRQSEERFRQIAASMADWIWETDAHGLYTYCSPRVRDTLGYTQEELLGQPFLALLTGEDRESASMTLLSLRRRQAPVEDMEVCRRTKSGGQVRTVIHGVPVFDEQGGLIGYRGTERDISRRKVLEAQVETMSLTDTLTGLANRNLILERLRQAQARSKHASGYRFGVLYVDVDRFKTINDSLGHLAGDRVLRQLAARLSECVRGLDTVARYGADEYVILLEDIADVRMAAQVARRVVSALAVPLDGIDGHEVRLSASVGVLVDPSPEDSPENCIRKADIAMNRAKAQGGGRSQVYVHKMLVEAERRLGLERSLDEAVVSGQLFLHYQPIVDLANGRMVGAEALVRWNHPERGLIMPGEFIPLAEQSGRIDAIGRFVLDRACRDMAAWRMRHPDGPEPKVAVNLSVRHLESPKLLPEVTRILSSWSIEPGRLVLEITETSLLHNDLAVLAKLEGLRAMGVRLAMDDFGTGYSSLAYLQRLPLDELKIDLQFVRHIATSQENRAIVRAIVALAGGLGLSTLAEGVETAEQRDILLSLGCRYAQGYLFSRPVSAEAFEAQWFGEPDAAGQDPNEPEEDVA